MPKDLISLSLPAPKLTAIDNALSALETTLTELVALEPDARKRLPKMGGKSEAFCRQALSVVSQNPQIVNPSLGLASAQADLAALDLLRPRRQRPGRQQRQGGLTRACRQGRTGETRGMWQGSGPAGPDFFARDICKVACTTEKAPCTTEFVACTREKAACIPEIVARTSENVPCTRAGNSVHG